MAYKNVRLGDLVEVISGGAFKSKFFTEENTGMPLIRIRDVTKGYSETYYFGEFDDKYIINDGDLLITMDGEFNIREWHGGQALLNQRVCKIESKDPHLKQKFLLYVMPAILREIEDKTPYVTVKHLSVKKIIEAKIPLPSVEIQEKIIEILYKSQLLIKQREQQIEALSALKQSIFVDMFGTVKTNNYSFKKSKLGDFALLVTSGSTPKGGSTSYLKEGVPLIRSQNVLWNELRLEDVVFISEETHKNMKRSQLNNRDVLLNITGASIGRSVVYRGADFEANVNQHVCIIRLNEYINPYYLSYYFANEEFQKNVVNKNIGATRQAFNYTQIKNFDILVPDLSLQNAFEDKVKQVDKYINLLSNSLEQMNLLYDSILHKSFNGELFKEGMKV